MTTKEQCFLITLSIKFWTAYSLDKKVTDEVAIRHNTCKDTGRYNKRLLGKATMAPIEKAKSDARTMHNSMTLPWADKGDRIIPISELAEYGNKMRPLLDEFDRQVENLLREYWQHVVKRETVMAGLYRMEDYPSIDKVRKKFGHTTEIKPISASSDIRLPGSSEMEEDLKSRYEDMCKQREEAAQMELMARLIRPTCRLITALTKEGRIFKSTHQAILEVARMIPQYNIQGDPILAKMAKDLFEIASSVTIDDMRDDDGTKKKISEALTEVLERLDKNIINAAINTEDND